MLKNGDLIDHKYRIIDQIGKGGYSRVYLSRYDKVNKAWAIKEVEKTGSESSEVIRQNLVAEINILKGLHNPHLPSIIDVFDRGDTYLIVMDYIEGETLRQMLRDRKKPFSDEQVAAWALQICDVFRYLHAQKPPIVYRDTKPSNIMLEPDGNIVLIDFGTARVYKQKNEEDTVCLGTPGYAAPEQYDRKRQSDPRTDCYNLGATMYHLVTGHAPAKGGYGLRPVREWNPAVSPGLEMIISKCMQQNPDDRYQTDDELIYDLQHYKEWDAGTQRVYKKRIWAFGITAAASIFCFGASIVSGSIGRNYENNSYKELIAQAEMSSSVKDAESYYVKAIHTDPTKGDAYLGLLDKAYLEDGTFDQQESDEFLQVLGYKQDGSNTDDFTELKKADLAAYTEVSYKAGLAYFYYYEDIGNATMSRPWFGYAKGTGLLDETKQGRAERLYNIADYYTGLSREDKAGDSSVSYKKYWNDLSSACAGNIVKSDNVRTALVMYREFSYQIATHLQEFKAAGISEKEVEAQIDNIKARLSSDVKGAETYTKDEYGQMYEETKNNLDAAETSVKTVYQEAES